MLKGICFYRFFFLNYDRILGIFPQWLAVISEIAAFCISYQFWEWKLVSFFRGFTTVFLDRTILNVGKIWTFFFLETVSCGSNWLWTLYITKDGLELMIDLPVSTSVMLGLEVCATVPGLIWRYLLTVSRYFVEFKIAHSAVVFHFGYFLVFATVHLVGS